VDSSSRVGSAVSGVAVLAGLGSALPAQVVTNHELARRLDTSDEWILSRTGIRQRHVVAPGQSTGDLAVEAGARALESAGTDRADLVVLATTTPDHLDPATAPQVAARLGLGSVPAFDLGAGCAGFVYGLSFASAMITSGTVGSVLLIGADTCSTIVDPEDRSTVPIFGDGAGAVWMRVGDPAENGAIGPVDLGSDGELAEFIMIAAGGSRQRSAGGPTADAGNYLTMNGPLVFKNAVERMSSSSLAVLERAEWKIDEVDRFVGHQANIRILDAIARHLDLPRERLIVNIDRVGNTGAASIPLALAQAAGDGFLTPGHRLLLTSFGSGAAWGSAVLTWPDVNVR